MSRVVVETSGFSFAYLKELLVSSMVRWVASDRTTTMMPFVVEQLVTLREQMRSEVSGHARRSTTERPSDDLHDE